MRNISEIKVSTAKVNGEINVTVFVFAEDDKNGQFTVGYERGVSELMCVYDGHVNTEDPGTGPDEEYERFDQAVESEYVWVFEIAKCIADKLTEK